MNIDLNDEYEDDDFEIYFTKDSLLEHLDYLEEDNLFKIHLIQNEEQNLKKSQQKIDGKMTEKLNAIGVLNKNIEKLQK